MSTIYTEWSSLFPDVAWVDISTDPQWVGAPVADQVTYEYAGTASLSFAIASARAIRLIRPSTITLTLSSATLRSRTRAYAGSTSIVIGGGVSVVGLHIVDGVAALSIAGSAAISRKVVRSYASTGAIVASGSSTRCRARCAQGVAAIITASSHSVYSHNCSRNVLGSAAIITGGQVAALRSRVYGYAGVGALSISGSYSYVCSYVSSGGVTLLGSSVCCITHAYASKTATAVTGGAAISIKLNGHYYAGAASISFGGACVPILFNGHHYAGAAALVSGGSSVRTRTRARNVGGGPAFGGVVSSTFVPVSVRVRAGTAALLSGGGSMRQRTVRRVGTAALVSGGDGAPSRSRALLGLGALSVGGSAVAQRAHTAAYDGAGVLSLVGWGALQRDIVIDGHASLALSSRTVLGLGIPLKAVHVVARVYPVSIAFEEILEFIYFNSPIGSFGHATSHVATDHPVRLCLAANVVTFASPLTKFFYSHATICIQSISDSPIERVLTFDSLSLQ